MQEERKKHHCRNASVTKGGQRGHCHAVLVPSPAPPWPDSLEEEQNDQMICALSQTWFSSLNTAVYPSACPPLSSCTWPLPFVTGRKVVSGNPCVVNGIMSGQTNSTEYSCCRTSPYIPGSIPRDSVNFENQVAEAARARLWDVCRKHSSDMKTPTWFCMVLGLSPRDLGCFSFVWWCWRTSRRVMITKLLADQCVGFWVILLNHSESALTETQDRAWSICLMSPF